MMAEAEIFVLTASSSELEPQTYSEAIESKDRVKWKGFGNHKDEPRHQNRPEDVCEDLTRKVQFRRM